MILPSGRGVKVAWPAGTTGHMEPPRGVGGGQRQVGREATSLSPGGCLLHLPIHLLQL